MVIDKVKEIIANQLGVDAGDINADTRLQEDLHADSLDTVELVMAPVEAAVFIIRMAKSTSPQCDTEE